MSGFRRRNYGTGHAYYLDDRKVPGVTKILGLGVPKGGLINWAGESVAEYVFDRVEIDERGRIRADRLVDDLRAGSKFPIPAPSGRSLPRTKLTKELSFAHNRDRDTQALKGQQVHDIARQLAETGEWTPGDDEAHLEGYADALVDWWHQWDPQPIDDTTPIMIESSILNETAFYAGTMDLGARLRGWGRCLVDYKAGRSGIYGETGLQLAAYRYGELWLDAATGEQHPMPEFDHCLGVWLRPDGTWETYPMRAGPNEFRLFRYAYEIAKWIDEPDLFKLDGVDRPIMTVKGSPIFPREDEVPAR